MLNSNYRVVCVCLGACVCLFPLCFYSRRLSTPSSIVVTVCTSCFNIKKSLYFFQRFYSCVPYHTRYKYRFYLQTSLAGELSFTWHRHWICTFYIREFLASKSNEMWIMWNASRISVLLWHKTRLPENQTAVFGDKCSAGSGCSNQSHILTRITQFADDPVRCSCNKLSAAPRTILALCTPPPPHAKG